MTKINSKYIKENVSCIHCGSSKLKRRYKKTFCTTVDLDGNIVPEEKINWRVYECLECEEHTHVNSTDTEIKSITESACLSFSCYEYYFCVNNDLLDEDSLCFCLVPSYDYYAIDFVIEDDIRDENIYGFAGYFLKNNIAVSNVLENTWRVKGTSRKIVEKMLVDVKTKEGFCLYATTTS